jgi:hypothetical protein
VKTKPGRINKHEPLTAIKPKSSAAAGLQASPCIALGAFSTQRLPPVPPGCITAQTTYEAPTLRKVNPAGLEASKTLIKSMPCW